MSPTVSHWLDARDAAPPALAARVRETLGADLEADAADVPARCLAAAERVLAPMLRGGCRGRAEAIELLTADALVTYAFEAASADVDALDALAASAMSRLCALVPGDARGDSAGRSP